MKKIAYILLIALLPLTSCKRYLDIKPYGQTIPKTADEFSSLLNSTLDKIDYGEGNIVGDITSVAYLECYADNLEASLTSYPEGDFIPIAVSVHLSDKQMNYKWIYECIRDCNIVIGNLEERDTRLGMNVLGTAYALRGVCYYELMRQFCEPYDPDNAADQLGVPIVTEFDMEAKPLRSTLKETADQAIGDLKKALEYDVRDEIYRFDNDVVAGYLARACFWSERYGEAIVYADRVLTEYPLLSGDAYKKMMGSQVQRTGNMIFKSGILSTSESQTGNDAIRKYVMKRPVSKSFVDLFAEGRRDIRYDISIGRKRVFNKNIFACLRSAEMCLILAESHYHEGDEDEALRYLNLLRSHRIENVAEYTAANLPPVDANDRIRVDARGNELTPLLYAILCERRKELFMEGDRWFELKRNGCPEFWVAKKGFKYYTNKFMYTFPLYVKDTELVNGLIQNPGYENVE